MKTAVVGGSAHALFTCPRSSLWHLHEIVRDYERAELPALHEPHLLDVGAHVGAFTLWADAHWPGLTSELYEPHPFVSDLCTRNVRGLAAAVHPVAVLGVPKRMPFVELHEGRRTLLGSSVHDLGWQSKERVLRVPMMRARDLPPCTLLKVDTEGEELPILRDYRHWDDVRCVFVEFHGEAHTEGRRFLRRIGFHGLPWTPGCSGEVFLR